MQYGNSGTNSKAVPTNMFKSYYVVWKPFSSSDKNEKKKGLNRTMQYGNDNIDMHFKLVVKSLNRTMQYGNKKAKKKFTRKKNGLNRTMQYGNT